MENKVQLCKLLLLFYVGMKILSATTVTTDFKLHKSIAHSVKMSSFDTSHGALPWPVMLA